MIEFREVCVAYDSQHPVLQNLSFTVQQGEFVSLVGTNGAGKSTTMRMINGLLKPDSGDVLVKGVSTREQKTSSLARICGFLFQNPDRQICCNTVRDELLFGFKAQGILTPEAESRVDEVIAEFGFNPADDPFLLNRGTRQLLALASIVVMEPEIIVLDEPTTGLDYRECVKVMNIVARLHKQGSTVVMVCHDMEVLADFAERVVVMDQGRVVADGATFEILRQPEVLEQASLIAPQIVDISLRLSGAPAFAQSAVTRANTLDQMEEALCVRLRKGE